MYFQRQISDAELLQYYIICINDTSNQPFSLAEVSTFGCFYFELNQHVLDNTIQN